MINPSFRELEKISKSRYKIAMMAAKRAKELVDGDKPKVKGEGVKPVTMAINEIMAGAIVRGDE
ncbi:DNA-directed RNA polymerase subunit omega [Peptoniphilaceae bacterium SGI.131]